MPNSQKPRHKAYRRHAQAPVTSEVTLYVIEQPEKLVLAMSRKVNNVDLPRAAVRALIAKLQAGLDLLEAKNGSPA